MQHATSARCTPQGFAVINSHIHRRAQADMYTHKPHTHCITHTDAALCLYNRFLLLCFHGNSRTLHFYEEQRASCVFVYINVGQEWQKLVCAFLSKITEIYTEVTIYMNV